MYQVRINADPEHFLDWDRPLKEQTSGVREILNRVPKFAQYEEAYGSNLPIGQRINLGHLPATYDKASPEFSRVYGEAGLPGIKYLDQGSRGAGEGSRNYVVFDDKIIEIMRKYGLAGSAGAAMAAEILQRQNGGQPQGQAVAPAM